MTGIAFKRTAQDESRIYDGRRRPCRRRLRPRRPAVRWRPVFRRASLRRPAWSLPYRRSQPHPRSDRESGPLASAMGVIGHAQGLHSAAHRMRPRSLGDPPSGSRSPLQSPLRSDFHCDRYRPPVAVAPCALRLPGRQPGPRIDCRRRAGAAPPKGAVPGTNKYSSDVMDHCATRAHCANPRRRRGPPLRWRSVAAGTRNETALKRLGPARRATVARSLRSLRPHHSRTAPGHSFRPRWLRCARVSQKTITSGQTLRTVQLRKAHPSSGDRHDHHRTDRNPRTFRNRSSLRARSALRRDARARRVRHPGRLGRRRRHRRGARGVPHPRPGRRPGRVPARRRTREPALGFRQHLLDSPGPSVSTAPPTS